MIMSEVQAAAEMADEAPAIGAGGDVEAFRPTMTPDDLRAAVRAQIDMNGWSQKAAAKKIGLGESVFSLWLKGTYQGDNAKVEAGVAKWLALLNDGDASARVVPAAPAIAMTPTLKRVVAGLRFAQTFGALTVIHGGAGGGKTRACTWYQKQSVNVFIATATPTEAGVAACLRMICRAVKVDRLISNLGASEMMDDVCKKLEEREALLIVDEAQHLTTRALDQVRSIHDRVGVGLALVGNNQIYANLTGGRREAHFAQLFSRIGKRVALTRPLKEDVDAIARAFGIQRREELDYLHAIGARPGALRGVVHTLRSAALMASEDEDGQGRPKPLGLAHLQAAWADLGAEA